MSDKTSLHKSLYKILISPDANPAAKAILEDAIDAAVDVTHENGSEYETMKAVLMTYIAAINSANSRLAEAFMLEKGILEMVKDQEVKPSIYYKVLNKYEIQEMSGVPDPDNDKKIFNSWEDARNYVEELRCEYQQKLENDISEIEQEMLDLENSDIIIFNLDGTTTVV